MNEDSSTQNGRKAEACTGVESLINQDIKVVMYISRNKILIGIASLIVISCGFLISMAGILGTLWFKNVSASHLWWMIPVITIIFTFCLLVPLAEIDKIRRKCEKKCVSLLRKN